MFGEGVFFVCNSLFGTDLCVLFCFGRVNNFVIFSVCVVKYRFCIIFFCFFFESCSVAEKIVESGFWLRDLFGVFFFVNYLIVLYCVLI